MSRRKSTQPTRLPRGPALVAASLLAGAPLGCGSSPKDNNADKVMPPQQRPSEPEPPQVPQVPPQVPPMKGSGSAIDAADDAMIDAGVDASSPQTKPQLVPPQKVLRPPPQAPQPQLIKKRQPPVRPMRPVEDPPVLPVESNRSMSTQPSLVDPFDRRGK